MTITLELYPAMAITRLKHSQAAARNRRTLGRVKGGGSGAQIVAGSVISPAMTVKVDAPKMEIVIMVTMKNW
jgi:hypothetical protein